MDDYSTTAYLIIQFSKEETNFHRGKEQQAQAGHHQCTNLGLVLYFSTNSCGRRCINLGNRRRHQSDSTSRPITFGTCSLTDPEKKNSEIEKEALAIVFECGYFHLYLYGKSFQMETDHRPHEYIFKPKASGKPATARVE